jgi:hypothetical protein
MMNEQELAERRVLSLRRWTNDLHWFVSVAGTTNLGEMDERNPEAFPYEWDDVVDRTRRVIRNAEDGLLGPAALAELRGITQELTELLPTMRRLRLRVPDLDALARAASSDPATAQPT